MGSSEINESIEKAEIPVERLEEIFLIQQDNPEQLGKEASPEEMEEFSRVMANISQIQQTAEIEIVDSLKQKSFDIQSFNQMAQKIQEDQRLLNRLQTLFSNQQEGI